MANDYMVPRLSDEEICAIATKARRYFGVNASKFVDIVDIIQRDMSFTIKGEVKLSFKACPDKEMKNNDALTEFKENQFFVYSKATVNKRAEYGVGRDRFSLAHELGHAVLRHDKAPMARETGINALTPRPKAIPSDRSAERQANVFASAFMVDRIFSSNYESAEAIAIDFGVSIQCAEIRYAQISFLRNKPRLAQKFKELSSELRSVDAPQQRQYDPMLGQCTQCGAPKLLKLGVKFMCNGCGGIMDSFPDGDGPA